MAEATLSPPSKGSKLSESSSQTYTPEFTPSTTPLPEKQQASTDMSMDKDAQPEAKAEPSDQKDEAAIAPEQTEASPALAAEATVEDKPAPVPSKSPPKPKTCKKHAKGSQKRSKRKKKECPSSSESSDESLSSSSESSEDSDSSDDSSSDDEAAKKRRRKKARKAKDKKAAKKAKRAKPDSSEESSDSDSDSSSASSSEEEAKRRRKRKKAKKKKAVRRAAVSDSDDESSDSDQERTRRRLKAIHLQALGSGRSAIRSRIGRAPPNPILINDNVKVSKKNRKKAAKAAGSSHSSSSSKLSFLRADELWDRDLHMYKLTPTTEFAEQEDGEHCFVVRRRFDWEGKYSDTVVDIKTKTLREALQKVMAGCKQVSLAEDTPSIDPNMLFLYLEDLRTYRTELKATMKSMKKKKKKKERKAATKTVGQVKVLIKYLDKDYRSTKKTLYPLLAAGNITFDLLWALFKSNEIAYTPIYNHTEARAFRIEYATKESSFMKGTWYEIEGRYTEFDGKAFGTGRLSVEIEAFKGPRKITSLACYPLHCHKDYDTLQPELIERGRKWVDLAKNGGMHYKFAKGMAFMKRKRQILKVVIDGRVMVDPATFRRINPNYPISTVKPEDPDLLEEEERDSDDESCCCAAEDEDDSRNPMEPLADADEPQVRMKLVLDEAQNPHILDVEVDEHGNEVQKEDIDKLPGENGEPKTDFTDEELLIASPVVLGFAFSEKLWLEFSVSSIHEIEWNNGAFESLVLPANQKEIVRALVESHKNERINGKNSSNSDSSKPSKEGGETNIDDVIQGKGRGLVAVLHGTPGTGKTLTAEGIAELLKCPLYMVSAGELGTNPRELEQELQKILDVAHGWGAVLLLDEADVFLEKRSVQDIHRNALVSIFLRQLEYFQGILFLTTNKVETFDEAFQSRIHIALRYAELDFKARRAVFKLFLDKVAQLNGVEMAVFKDSDLDRLARQHTLNGRQIKNVVRTAQALALNEKKPLSMAHITKVLEVGDAFERELRGGTGYLDAMRSYT